MNTAGRTVMDLGVDIDAPPAVVWDLLSDLRRMGEWSPACTGARWPAGSAGPEVGLRFQGTNRIGRHRWRTTATIVAATPERELTWCVSFLGFAVSQLGYRMEPLPGRGTRLTESWRDLRTSPILHLKPIVVAVTGQRDVPTVVEHGIRTTLAQLKAAAERVSAASAHGRATPPARTGT
jgi:uncharacterized protein YndB with AHSA1/START domain